MRLLRVKHTDGVVTSFSLTEFLPPRVPPRYAILSHRWGDEEVILQDLQTNGFRQKAGYKKLKFCAEQAAKDDIEYFWVDTCCIDKTNSTELSEAINSMFKWYQNAAKCYVYLPDVSSTRGRRSINDEIGWKSSFQHSAWFTRGWTLQELIAPKVVEFFSCEGKLLGNKRSLEKEIHQITRISVDALRGQPLSTFGIEERFTWAGGRDTSREEDTAYCLLGIFNVYMPLIYGEGRDNAMARLKNSFYELHAEELNCHQSLKTCSYEAHKNRNPVRVPGTCQWLLSHPQFCDWYAGKATGLLWVSADPGCGKSVLCRSLIDQDLRSYRNISVCYFFFKDNSEQNTLAPALSAILHQLFAQQPQLIRHAMPAWRANGINLQRETNKMWEILMACATDPNSAPIVCVLDALDECHDKDRRELIERLCSLCQSQEGMNSHKLKILITSRPYANVQRWFAQTTEQFPQIRLRGEGENNTIGEEINLVIRGQVKSLAAEFDLSAVDCQNLLKQLLQMQHRTYLWLHLAIEEVREACRESIYSGALRLESLPESVEQAYDRILGRIDKKKQPQARRILLIIVGARRPLKLSEMALALSAADADERESEMLVAIDARRLEKDICQQCGLFIYIQHSRLYLIHQTAKEFLLAESTGPHHSQHSWKSVLSMRMVDLQMARLCMTHLLLKSQESCLSEVKKPEESPLIARSFSLRNRYTSNQQLSGFSRYCAKYWSSHLQDDMLEGEHKLTKQALRVYKVNKSPYKFWPAYAFPSAFPVRRLKYECPVQHKISVLDHPSILEELFRCESIDVDERDTYGRTALHYATEAGNSKIVQILIDKGADIHVEDCTGATPIFFAMFGRCPDVKRMLLD